MIQIFNYQRFVLKISKFEVYVNTICFQYTEYAILDIYLIKVFWVLANLVEL
jgi:hypothetical protein